MGVAHGLIWFYVLVVISMMKLLPIYHFLPLVACCGMIISCADMTSTNAATPLPVNETMGEYMNPKGYAYAVVDRVSEYNP